MNCIIIDDDSVCAKIVETFVRRTESLNLLATYSSAIEAINSFNGKDEIHIIFLDIEMPEMTGLEFIKTLKDPPQIIIVSGKESYALKAFEYSVTDYLLKPVDYSRFFQAVEKAKKLRPSTESGNDEIFIKKKSSLFRIKYNDILYIEALENYIKITTFHVSYTIHFTLKAIYQKLPESIFKRVHRSYIVNSKKINYIEDNNIIMHTEEGEKSVPIGKSYRGNLLEDFNLM